MMTKNNCILFAATFFEMELVLISLGIGKSFCSNRVKIFLYLERSLRLFSGLVLTTLKLLWLVYKVSLKKTFSINLRTSRIESLLKTLVIYFVKV